MQYQHEQLAAADASGKEQERQLLAAVQTAGDAYEDAVLAANEAAVTAGRAVAAAGISDASDSTLAVGEITVEQMELQLEKLERLLEADGRICAPSDGLITEIAVNIGERTADTPAVRMADLTKGYRFIAELTKEQETYIGAGDFLCQRNADSRFGSCDHGQRQGLSLCRAAAGAVSRCFRI